MKYDPLEEDKHLDDPRINDIEGEPYEPDDPPF